MAECGVRVESAGVTPTPAQLAQLEVLTTTAAAAPRRGSIRIADFDFDLDKDGKVDEFEKKVVQALHAADTDGSGTLSPFEMVNVLKGIADSHKTNKRLGKMVTRLSFMVVLLIASLVAIAIVGSMVGGDAIKESKVPDCSSSTDKRCQPGGLVRVGAVESFASLFDLPAAPTNQLAYLRDITLFVDMTAAAAVGGAVEATFKIAAAYKRSDTKVWLVTSTGSTIELDAAAKTGSITMDGATYPVSETAPATGRRLETHPAAPVAATMTGQELAAQHEERRRQLSNTWGGALMTSGGFTVMASGGVGRRQLSAWGGALMTSGSPTMMASSSVG